MRGMLLSETFEGDISRVIAHLDTQTVAVLARHGTIRPLVDQFRPLTRIRLEK
jgi:hypothetical protein